MYKHHSTRLLSAAFARAGSARSICAIAMLFGLLAVSSPVFSAAKALGTCDTVSAVEVEATAGTLGPTGYTTLKGAFDAINAGTHQGAINIEVCSSTNEGTTPATLNSSGAGAAVYTAVGVRPLVDALTITGNPATGFGVIQLKGADNVTIDGDNPNTAGTNRDLTINNTNTTTAIAGSVIRIATSTVASTVISADNNTIRNLVLNGNVTNGNAAAITSASGSSNSSFVIYAGGNGGANATDAPTALTSVTANTAPSGTTINNLLVQNNAMNQAARAFVFNGAAASVSNGVTLVGNTIGASGVQVGAPPYNTPSSTVHTRGIFVAGTNAVTITGNTIQNMLSYIATTASAIDLVSPIGNGGVTISGNTINTAVNNSASGGAINGIIVASSASNPTIIGNTISTVQTMAGANAQGISATQTGTGGLIEANRVSAIYSRGSGGFAANGINLAGGSGWTVQNNFVSDVNSFFNNGDFTLFGPFGIRITAGSNDKIYNNTVNLSGPVVGGSALAPSAAFVIASTSSTGVDVRNNIFINQLTGAFAGSAVAAIMLPSGGTSAMNLTLNNNDYVAPATIIGQVGTTGSIVSTYTAAAFDASTTAGANNLRNYTSTLLAANTNNDNASIVTDPVLVSATDLHITVGSPAQNTGATIAAVTNDIDAQLRPGGGSYDIGADEVDGVTPPANDMRATAFIDPINGGVKLANAAFSPQASFTNMGTVTQAGVTVRYRIVNAGLIEVYNQTATIPSIAFNASTTVTFPAATLPIAGIYSIVATAELVGDTVPANDSINGSLTVAAPLAGTYTVGSGGAYPSLTNNGGIFQELNSLGASANITISIISDLTGETGTHALNEIAGGFSTLIQPTGAARAVIGTSTVPCLVRLNGADNVTIDGSLTPGGTTRDLTFNNTSTSTSSAVLCVSSLGAGLGASNNTLRNLNVFGNDPTQTLTAISLGGLTPGSAGTNNDNNRVENNLIRRAILGIFSGGAGAATQNVGTVITRNDMTGTGVDRLRRGAILVFNDNGIQITRNDIGGISTNESADAYGIGLGTQTIDTANVTGGGVTNALVSRNRINGVVATSDFSAAGIAVGGGATGANEISNNMISGVSSPATPNDFVAGIYIVGAVGSSTKLYYNSVSMDGDRGLPAAAQTPSYAVAMTGTDPAVELKNNIFSTTQTAASGGATAESYAIGTNAVTFVNLDSNFNVYNSVGVNAGFFRSGSLGSSLGTDYATLALWQAAISDDANSVFADPLFISTSDLHLQATSPAQNIGTPVAGVTLDFDADTRNVTTPDIGADEFVPPNTAPSITPTAGGIARQQGSAGSNSQIAAVTDAETAVGSLVVTTTSVPAGLTVTGISNTNGNITADVVATCSATVGTNLVGLRVTDGGVVPMTADADLTVNVAANTPPVLGSYAASGAIVGGGTTVTPSAAPSDTGPIYQVNVSAPTYTGTISVDFFTGVVTLGNAGPVGPHTVTVTAIDSCGGTTTADFVFTVSAANSAPTISASGGVTKKAGDPASSLTIAQVLDAEDAEPALSVTVNGGASATNNLVTVSSIGTDVMGTVTANVVAACGATNASFTLRVTDSGTLNNEATLNVAVTANTAPTLTYNAVSLLPGTGTVINPSSGPSDSGSVSSVAVQSQGTYTGTVSVNGSGNVTIGNAGPVGSHTITIRATDNCSLTTDAALSVTVLGDAVFANGFEDVVRTPAQMELSAGKAGQTQSLKLPTLDLQDLANLPGVVDAIEFSIGNTRSLLQVRNLDGSREMRLLSFDAEGRTVEGEWLVLFGQQTLELEWSNRERDGASHVETALKIED